MCTAAAAQLSATRRALNRLGKAGLRDWAAPAMAANGRAQPMVPPWHRRLLRARRERPCSRAAERG